MHIDSQSKYSVALLSAVPKYEPLHLIFDKPTLPNLVEQFIFAQCPSVILDDDNKHIKGFGIKSYGLTSSKQQAFSGVTLEIVKRINLIN